MKIIETEGLVLKSYGLAEADKIVVFLTQEYGLVRGVAKGAKRLKSKFGSSLEPFSVVRLSYAQKEERELVSIRSSEIIKSFFGKAANPFLFQKFAYIVELLSDFAPPSDPNERLYKMAKICLETSEENPDKFAQVILYFELWLLKLGGYLPSWDRCDVCHREFEKSEPASLLINFQLACGNCRNYRNNLAVSSSERAVFGIAQKIAPKSFLDFTFDKIEEIQSLSNILKRIIGNILGREIISEKFLLAANVSE